MDKAGLKFMQTEFEDKMEKWNILQFERYKIGK